MRKKAKQGDVIYRENESGVDRGISLVHNLGYDRTYGTEVLFSSSKAGHLGPFHSRESQDYIIKKTLPHSWNVVQEAAKFIVGKIAKL